MIVIGCGGGDDNPSVDASHAAGADGMIADADSGVVPRVVPADCRFSSITLSGVDYECGDLIVYENRADPDAGILHLHYLQVHGDADTGTATIYLDGGPGGNGDGIVSYINFLGAPLLDPFLAHGDFLVIAQRGTTLSVPNLACTDDDADLDACAARLSASADLANFNTAANADDVDDLRAALGYDQLNLYGISYGSRLALEVLRRHGDHVRAASAGGTVPAQIIWPAEIPASFYAVVSGLADACTAQTSCHDAFGDLSQDLLDGIAALDKTPIMYTTSAGDEVTITGEIYANLLFTLFYGRGAYQYLPMMISDLAEGNTGRVGFLLDIFFGQSGDGGVSTGLYYSVVCGELFNPPVPSAFDQANVGVPQAIQDAIRPSAWDGLITACETWPKGPSMPVLTEAVASDVPTLLPAGELDPITPPRFSEAAAEMLSTSYTVVFDLSGHGSTLQSTCGRNVLFAFLDTPTEAPDSTCAADLPINFVTGSAAAPPRVDGERLALERRLAPIPPQMRERLHRAVHRRR